MQKKLRQHTPQQRLKLKRQKNRAWQKAHPEAARRWKLEHRERYLKYLKDYWWGPRHEELLAMKRKTNRLHREERRLYRIAAKKRAQSGKPARRAKRRRSVRKTA